VDSGVNTFLGSGGGANDNKLHFHGGIGLNFKTVTVLATTQIGPEATQYPCIAYESGEGGPFCVATSSTPHGVSQNRYLNDVVVTWKISDKLTSMTDINYIYDDRYKASGGGVTQYLTYAISPILSVGGRAEVWRDDHNFYVAGFKRNFDFINVEGGYGSGVGIGVLAPDGNPAHNATFAEFTLGLNFKPAGLPKAIDGLTIRPEIRYDALLTNGSAYDAQTKDHQFTFGIDFVAPFTF
ncbi:MAG: outer membrane beta-barrel protein, partial [Caulobacteraceae bacterium]|nr:outer membrane beta-barrel protein [Caulobacteraceae bacterium]